MPSISTEFSPILTSSWILISLVSLLDKMLLALLVISSIKLDDVLALVFEYKPTKNSTVMNTKFRSKFFHLLLFIYLKCPSHYHLEFQS